MARQPRFDRPGAWHHVMNRGSGRRAVFKTDLDRRTMVALFAQLEERFEVEVHSYCLMGNHFHLLVRSIDGRLSEAMQWMSSRFTRCANEARGVDGAIFRGRFHSVAVDDPRHRLVVCSYIHANPIDLPWSRPLATYPWSSLEAFASGVSPDWLHLEEMISLAGGSEAVTIAAEARRLAPVDRAPLPRVSIDAASAAVEAMAGLSGEPLRRSQLQAIAVAIAVDVLQVEREAVERSFAVSRGALRVALSRGRKLVAGPAAATSQAAIEALQLVSDTSCNGRLLRHV